MNTSDYLPYYIELCDFNWISKSCSVLIPQQNKNITEIETDSKNK